MSARLAQVFGTALVLAALAGIVVGQSAAVSGQVVLVRPNSKEAANSNGGDSSGAVVWLEAADGSSHARPGNFKMIQKDKRFDPHVLVVPLGSTVAFPNLDPFFHNVFSLFDGRRFDLGLYEAGASRNVNFPRAGVCYIFCNIHPEMSAVVVVVDTPYYTVTSANGSFSIDTVPAGRYRLHVWHQRGKPISGAEAPMEIQVGSTGLRLSPIRLVESGPLLIPHKNKYGKDYDTSTSPSPLYR